MGDRQAHLSKAISLLSQHGDILDKSSVYETEPWGNKEQDAFYNMACSLRTKLSASDLLVKVNAIEDQLGRERTEKWGPRTIDIDIIAYEDQVIQTEKLSIPHPKMLERNFVLVPMMEIAGLWEHPVAKLSIEELFLECEDPCEVIMTEIKI